MTLVEDLQHSPLWHGNAPADEAALRSLSDTVPFPVPKTFLELLRHFDGGKGSIGEGRNKVVILSAREILDAHLFWEVGEAMPGHLMFGTNYDDFGLLFDTSNGLVNDEYPIVMCPVSSLSLADAEPAAESLADLFHKPLF